MTAQELECMLVEAFGEDFRDKAIVSPVGAFPLRDAFEECGLVDPKRSIPSGAYGVPQFISVRRDG